MERMAVTETQRSGARPVVTETVYAESRSMLVPAMLWRRSGPDAPAVVFPDGCMDLIWTGSRVLVAGADTGPVSVAGGGDMVALRFDSGVAPLVLGHAADALVNSRVDLSAILGDRGARRLTDRLVDAAEPAVELQRFAAAQLVRRPPPQWLGPATAMLASGRPVAEVADQISVSSRQLQRWSRHHYGYGAKSLQRILRVNAAMERLRSGVAPSDTAYVSGYADYAHMFRDFRVVTGHVPADFAPSAPR